MTTAALDWRAEAERLAPYAQASLGRAAELARRLHAEELVPEHWLAALLADEDCGATRIVLHAFADPGTIGGEVLALCPGIMVVGSGRTLPFSVRALAALHGARELAAARSAASLEPGDLCLAASRVLDPRVAARLAPLADADLEAAGEAAGAAKAALLAVPSRSLFENYSQTGLRALGASARAAGTLGRTAIAPAHLVLGCLEADEGLRQRTGLTAVRARLAFAGLDEDPTPLPERNLAASGALRDLLRSLPHASGTVAVLGWFLASGSGELVALLKRQKVTWSLFERCRDAFSDP
jgi:hypothetical protein